MTAAQRRAVLASLVEYNQTLQPERRHFLAQYYPLDVAFKVVGTGSVGLRDYVIYFEGNGPGDPLFLQIKEQPGSAYAPYVNVDNLASHQGQRVVNGQRAMQFQSDPFLGWTTIANRQYQVRQLNDHKGQHRNRRPGRGWPARICRDVRRTSGRVAMPGRATPASWPATSAMAKNSARPSSDSPRPTPSRRKKTGKS